MKRCRLSAILFCFLGIHLISQQQLILEMLNRRFQRSAVLTAERKGSGNPDRTDGIKTIRVLKDHPFQVVRSFYPVLAERKCNCTERTISIKSKYRQKIQASYAFQLFSRLLLC